MVLISSRRAYYKAVMRHGAIPCNSSVAGSLAPGEPDKNYISGASWVTLCTTALIITE